MRKANRWAIVTLVLAAALGGCGSSHGRPSVDAPLDRASDFGTDGAPVGTVLPSDAAEAGPVEASPDAAAADLAGAPPDASGAMPDRPSDADANAAAGPCTGWGTALTTLASANAAHLIAAGYTDGSVAIWSADLAPRARLHTGPDGVRALAMSHDGTLVATATSAPGSLDAVLTVWSVANASSLWVASGIDERLNTIVFSQDDRFMLVTSNHAVRLYDVTNHRLAWSDATPDDLARLAFFTDSDANVFVLRDTRISVRRRDTGGLVRQQLQPQFDDYAIPSPSGDRLVGRAGSNDRLVVMKTSDFTVTDVAAPTSPLSIAPPGGFSADGSTFVLSGFNPDGTGAIVAWRTSDWTQLPLWTQGERVIMVSGGPHTQDFLVADGLGQITLVDAASGHVTATPPAGSVVVGQGETDSLRFSPDGALVASHAPAYSSNASTIIVWDARAQSALYSMADAAGSMDAQAFTSDGQSFVVVTSAGAIRVHDARDGAVVRTFGSGVTCVLASRDGTAVYAGGADGSLRRYHVADGAVDVIVPHLAFTASALALSPDGLSIAASGPGAMAAVYRIADGMHVWSHATDSQGISPRDGRCSLGFSPDGNTLAVKTNLPQQTLFLYDAKAGTPIDLKLVYAARGTLDISRDGRLLAVGGDHGAQLIRLADRTLVRTITDEQTGYGDMPVAFSPVRDQIIVGSSDGHIDSSCGVVGQFGGP